jgi:general L-amino acid transport system permease protein
MAATAHPPNPNTPRSILPAFLRDVRVLQVLGQIVFVIVVVTLASQIAASIVGSLRAKNLEPNTTFLNDRAGFDISNAPDWYTSNSSYGTAFLVGVTNTLRVVVVGLVATTIVGILVGIALLSSNWLIRTISRVYVEILRNTPLLVQLFVWYFIGMLSLPPFNQAITLPNEGVVLLPLGRVIAYVLIYAAVWMFSQRAASHTRTMRMTAALVAILTMEIAFWLSGWLEGWANLYGRSDLTNLGFVIYAAVSLALIAGAYSIRGEVRWRLLGLTSGQFIGGVVFYFGVLPFANAAVRAEIFPAVIISVRGFVFPEFLATSRFAEWVAFTSIGVALAFMLWVYWGRLIETTGRAYPRGWYAVIAVVAFTVIGWVLVGLEPAPATITVEQDGAMVTLPIEEARTQDLLTSADEQLYSRQPLLVILPEQRINRAGIVSGLRSGSTIPPEYMALLLGLTVYTSAFVAEIVRAGILAVPRGQIEAARALGFSTAQTLQMIILPQALRVIIPPLGNQYLNLSKNSSLAIAIAYADVVLVTQTVMNQSGQSVTGITMLMIVYLIMSLSISVLTNLVNRRFQLVTR